MGSNSTGKIWRKFSPAVSILVFAFSLFWALLPKSPKEPIDLPLIVREFAGEVGNKYWWALVAGGLVTIWRNRKLLAPLLLTLLLTQVVVEALKLTVGEMRPDGRLFNSFPSGHTTSSFAYAAFMSAHFRWGWLWYLFATVVGLSRIIINAHWWHDVLGGAALGYLLTTTFCRCWHSKRERISSSQA